MQSTQELVSMIAAAWPMPAMTTDQAALYLDGLSDIPADIGMHAVRRLILAEDFRPTVAKIRRTAADVAGLCPPSLAAAMVEAESLLEWRRRSLVARGAGMGPGDPPNVHPAVQEAVAASGPDWMPGVFSARYRVVVDAHVSALVAEPMFVGQLGAGASRQLTAG